MEDTYRTRGLRMQLVKNLRNKGFDDEKLLSAFANVKRHLFLDSAFSDWAYKDVAFPIAADQTISQPSTVALQTSLLDVKQGEKILEIGTGSGYQACILAYLGAKVYSIERQKSLFRKTNKRLIEIGFSNIRTIYGDGYQGLPRFAPFDKIIVTCGANHVPATLLNQLKIGGKLVIPVGREDIKTMVKMVRMENGKFDITRHGECSFVPFLLGIEQKAEEISPSNRVLL